MTTEKPSPVDFLVLLAISLLLLHSSTAASPPEPVLALPPAAECVRDLVMFSPCLAFVSLPPNNLSASASSACCDVFSATLANASSSCLCYLLRDARMLGFPIDVDRVLSLSTVCARSGRSLDAICSADSEAMPPSQNGTDSESSSPPVSAPSLAPESDTPTEPPSWSADSDDSGENSSPPTQGAEMSLRRRKSPPKAKNSPRGRSSSASGDQIRTGKCWSETGSLIFPLLMLVSYVAIC